MSLHLISGPSKGVLAPLPMLFYNLLLLLPLKCLIIFISILERNTLCVGSVCSGVPLLWLILVQLITYFSWETLDKAVAENFVDIRLSGIDYILEDL